MSDSAARRAIVVGAGIGGLAAAIALRNAGFAVTVLEQAESARELGFALLLAPNAMQALRRLGVADALRAEGAVIETGELRAGDGRVLKRAALGPMTRSLGAEALCALRPVLHGVLLRALGEDALRLGARAVGFEQGAGTVHVQLASGDRLPAEILIGADGIHSVIRRQLLGEQPLRPSGLTAVRGVARVGRAALDGMISAQYFGRGIEAGLARASADTLYWFISSETAQMPGPDVPPREAALIRLGDFDPAFLNVVKQTDPEELRRDELFDRAPVARWGEGSVNLLGDAAHPMLPHAGQGAAQALEDAAVLGGCLARERDVVRALARYQALRIPRTTAVVRQARRNARLGRVRNPVLCATRDLLFRSIPAGVLARQLVAMSRVDLGA
jgi:2-polyprenyl-6-methoxyphenol hydroxylase-like FAD-dependent oxidoreductase